MRKLKYFAKRVLKKNSKKQFFKNSIKEPRLYSLLEHDGKLYEAQDLFLKRTIFYSINAFEDKFSLLQDRCFVCGFSREEKKFNDEHIFSNWILKKYKLHSRRIILPNGTSFTYGSYKIPCCVDCNSEMSRLFEAPLSKLFKKGYNKFIKEIRKNPKIVNKIFIWLCLIFIKTHLKDTFLDLERNKKLKVDGKISDIYGLESIHHIHCVARSFHTHAIMDSHVRGTMAFFPALIDNDEIESFDYYDLVDSKTILIRIHDIAIVAVLNDGCAVLNQLASYFEGVNWLSPLQLREVFAHFSFASAALTNNPKFASTLDPNEGYSILAKLEDAPIFDFNKIKFGNFLYPACAPMFGKNINPEIDSALKSGGYTFLWDKDKKFIDHSVRLKYSRKK